MAYYGSIQEVPPGDTTYANHCVDDKCSNCGNCCVDLLPLTKNELERLRRYAREHNLKEHRQAPFWDPNATDLTCPFRNQHTQKCEVYPVRPLICRSFTCAKPLDVAKHDWDEIHKTRQVVSLRYEVFGNTETVALLTAACMRGAGLL